MFTFILGLVWLQGGPDAMILNPPYDFTYFANTPALMSAFSTQTDLSYTWTLPNGETRTGEQLEVTLGDEDMHISMVASNATGEKSLPDDRIFYVLSLENVAEFPTITSLTALPATPRPGETVTVSADAILDADMDGPYTYHWFHLENGRPVRNSGESLTMTVPQDAVVGSVINVSLIVKDAAGNPSFPTAVSLLVSEGNLPPSGRILQPDGLSRLVGVGETLVFEGAAVEPEGEAVSYSWRFDGTEVSTANPYSHTFDQVGTFVVQLVTSDTHGNEDPLPPVVVVSVQEDTPFPETIIFSPVISTRMFAGDQLLLNGQVTRNNDADFDLFWTLTAVPSGQVVQRIEGRLPGRITIAEPGLYQLRFRAEKDGLASPDGANSFRWIAVQARDESPAPRLDYANGFEFRVANGDDLEITALSPGSDSDDLQWLWTVNGEWTTQIGPVFRYAPQLADSDFDDGVANVMVEAHVLGANGKPADFPLTHVVYVYRDVEPPMPTVNGLVTGDTLYVPLGEPFAAIPQLAAPVNPEDYTYLWQGVWHDEVLPVFQADTLQISPINLDRTGVLSLLFVPITKGDAPRVTRGHLTHIQVYDPNKAPIPAITRPTTDQVRLEPGAALVLEGLASDPNHVTSPNSGFGFKPISSTLRWRIEGENGFRRTVEQNFPLTIALEEPGEYQVFLDVTNSVGLSSTQSAVLNLRVTEPVADAGLEPNDTREQAGLIGVGAYSELSVGPDDPIDWYRFQLAEAGSAVELDIDLSQSQGDVGLQVFFEDNLVLEEVLAAGSNQPFAFVGGDRGEYFLRLSQAAEAATAGKMLSLSVGLTVSNPRLIFGYPKTDTIDQTVLSLTNPTHAIAQTTIVARSVEGEVLAEAELSLQPNGQYEAAVDEIFTQIKTAAVAWIQVRSDANINGFSMTRGRDGETAVAETAAVAPLNKLVVPHIAEDTNSWFTRAAITNAGPAEASTRFSAAAGDFDVSAVAKRHQHALLDFQSFFGGDLPDGVSWGRFEETAARPTLSGVEIFGAKQGSPRLAALNLSGDNRRNPGFVYQNRDIYFPHIAKDTASFWTGIAFVNTSPHEAALILAAYDDNGGVMAEAQLVLGPNEKRVGLAQTFFTGVDTGISWIHLKTDSPIQGYALFGNAAGEQNRLAGFPAATGGSRELRFQKVLYEAGSFWTGIAVVNLSSAPAELVYEAYDATGAVVARVTDRGIGPFQKDVALVESLFGGALPVGTAWVRVTSTQPLVGFQLFGDAAGKFMAASQ